MFKKAIHAVFPLLLAAGPLVAAPEDDPVLWPERERTFFLDGAGLLLDEEARDQILAAHGVERTRLIDEFLDRDPIPETPQNELVEGIERRRRLARTRYPTFLDDRARVLFLHGEPLEKVVVECGQTFLPLEIWTYEERPWRPRVRATTIVGDREKSTSIPLLPTKPGVTRVVFFRPSPEVPYRIWLPFMSKRALYNSEMEYYLLQWEELGARRVGKRFDLRTCDETPLVDKATGIEGLRGFRPDRPTNAELSAFIGPPEDLTAWAAEAAETDLSGVGRELPLGEVVVQFPERVRQRILTRILLSVPPEAELGIDTEDEERPEHRLTVVGAVEHEGGLFEQFRVRFRVPPGGDGVPVALAVDRALRPERAYLVRLQIIDEVGGGETFLARGLVVPAEPVAVAELPVPDDAIVTLGEQLAAMRVAGRDSLVLAPPAVDVILGTWRAETLIAGQRIAKVVFLVDGVAQLTKARPPFSAEVRLAEFPREQTVRAEGYDADGELVAADEVVVNQPRGSFRVRIVEPRRGTPATGVVTVKAEIVVPEERRVEEVRIQLNDEVVETLTTPPWETAVQVPSPTEFSYITAVAVLDDGSRGEDVRYVNAPQYLEEVDVDLIEVLTTVLDADQRPVRDLTRDDFQIFEDGRRQQIDKFEQVEDLPLALGITIDTSGSMASALHIAKQAASGFLDNVIRSSDRVFAVAFAGRPALLIPPTDDVRAVAASLEGLSSLGFTALHDAVVTSLYYFRGVRGRRALIVLSDGDDTASFYPYRDVLEYARRSGVVIYTVGIGSSGIKGQLKRKLSQLAVETGGRVFFIQRIEQLARVYSQIEDELRSQYLLTYHSDNVADHETFRAIEVRVSGRLKARAMRGYYP